MIRFQPSQSLTPCGQPSYTAAEATEAFLSLPESDQPNKQGALLSNLVGLLHDLGVILPRHVEALLDNGFQQIKPRAPR